MTPWLTGRITASPGKRRTRPWARAVLRCREAADSVLFRLAPFLDRYCGEVIVIAEE